MFEYFTKDDQKLIGHCIEKWLGEKLVCTPGRRRTPDQLNQVNRYDLAYTFLATYPSWTEQVVGFERLHLDVAHAIDRAIPVSYCKTVRGAKYEVDFYELEASGLVPQFPETGPYLAERRRVAYELAEQREAERQKQNAGREASMAQKSYVELLLEGSGYELAVDRASLSHAQAHAIINFLREDAPVPHEHRDVLQFRIPWELTHTA